MVRYLQLIPQQFYILYKFTVMVTGASNCDTIVITNLDVNGCLLEQRIPRQSERALFVRCPKNEAKLRYFMGIYTLKIPIPIQLPAVFCTSLLVGGHKVSQLLRKVVVDAC